MRRAFSGLWCRTHRLQKLGLASIITVVAGWFGIPFGIFFTPVALFKLARGGEQPAEANRALLRELAEIKIAKGETAAAIRCLEEALKFGDIEALRASLTRIYQTSLSSVRRVPESKLLTFLVVLFGASTLGFAIGFFDYLITTIFVAVIGESGSLYTAMLSWVPLIAMIFFGGLILSGLVGWALASSETRQHLLGLGLAMTASFLAFYGILNGQIMGDFLKTILIEWPFDSLSTAFFATGSAFTQGGYWVIEDSLAIGEAPDIIFMLILLVGGVFYLASTLFEALSTVDWQRLLGKSMAPSEKSAIGGWVAIGGVILSLAMVTVFFLAAPQQGSFGGDSPKVEALIDEATTFLAEGDFDSSLRVLEQAAEEDPRSFSARVMLGWAYYYAGENSKAAVEFEAVQMIDPQLPDSYLGLGFIQTAMDEWDAAHESFDRALELATEDFSLADAHYGKGEVYFYQNKLDQAIPHLQEAIRYDPQITLAYLELSLAYFRRAEFYKAIEQCENLVILDPEWAAPHALLSAAYYQVSEESSAEIELARTLALEPEDPYSLYALVAAYSGMRRFSQAEEHMLMLADLSPDSEEVLANLASLYSAQGKFELAMDTVERAFIFNDTYMQAYLALAQIYVDQEQLDMALESLRQSQEKLPGDRTSASMFAYVHYLQGDLTQALRAAEEAIETNPYDGDAYETRAFTYRDQGQIDKAFEDARTAVHLSPKSDTAHYILALVLMDTGDTQRAVHELETFLDLYWDRAYVSEYKDAAENALAELKGGS
jgi:tetratricopeptide (TPR) repeat protein